MELNVHEQDMDSLKDKLDQLTLECRKVMERFIEED